MFSVTLRDFHPINTWTPDRNDPSWAGDPKYLIDMTTGRSYWNDSKDVIRFKFFLLTLGTPIVHSIAMLVRVALKIIEFQKGLQATMQDLLKIVVTTPVALVGLELAAIYGMITPYNGRKLYASIERTQYGDSCIAPCFQPILRQDALTELQKLPTALKPIQP